MLLRISIILLLFQYSSVQLSAQKLLQIEKIGSLKLIKIQLGEPIFVKTIHDPDSWYYATLEDVLLEAEAIVFPGRIIPLKDIRSIKRRKKSAAYGAGKSLQYSAGIPVFYEVVYGLINPPIEWKSLAIISGGAFTLGSLMRLIPPKQYRVGKKYRLRVLDLTFYSK